MEEENRRVLREVFGESSSDEEEERQVSIGDSSSDEQVFRRWNNKWEQVKEIKGLWLCRDFLPTDKQSSLLASFQKEGLFAEASHNQAMRFGDLPAWATELSRFIHKAVAFCEIVAISRDLESYYPNSKEVCPMPTNLLWREPFFDQLIVNVYQPGNMCACRSHAL